MNAQIAPVILLIFFWIFVGIPVSIAKKAAQQKKASRPAASKQQPADEPVKKREDTRQERLTTLTPSITLTGHDDSIYQGSLNAVTGEGYDPCHDEQMTGLTLAGDEDFAPRAAQAKPGIPLGWTNNDVVRGIVMSEILNRKKN